MLKITGQDFEMEQVKTSPFFNLKLLTIVNEGKSNQRSEMKLDGYSVSFDACIDRIITHRLYLKNITVSLNGYIEEYLKEGEYLRNSEVFVIDYVPEDSETNGDSDDSD